VEVWTGQGTVADYCGHGSEHLCFINVREFFDDQSNYFSKRNVHHRVRSVTCQFFLSIIFGQSLFLFIPL
jgi:hypothetical protein